MQKDKIRRLTRGFLFSGCAVIAMGAGRAGADTTDDLLAKLLAKGILTQQEYDQLKQRKAAEPPPAVQAPSGSDWADRNNTFVRMMDKGVGLHLGPVDLSFSGELNAFYVYDSPQKPGATTAVTGGLAGVDTRGASAIRNGLLPNNFNIDISTVQDGIKVDAHFGMYPGLNSSPMASGANGGGNPVALGTSGIDFRQQFLTVGTDTFGTVKFGRDIGLFGQEAILNDFTLFGVGGTAGSAAPGNTSLGRIGLGYVYTDFMPQITYTTPSFDGFSAAVGIFQPITAVGSVTLAQHDTPQVQAKLAYAMPDNGSPWKFAAWTNVVTQNLQAAPGAGKSIQGTGWDFGGKIDYGPAEITGTGYIGSGLGTTGLFIFAESPGYTDANGVYHAPDARDSSGFYVQGSYTFASKFTLSGSYGDSHLDLGSGDDPVANGTLVKDNESYAFGAKYKLTSWVNLIAEFNHTTATAHNGNKAEEDSFATGAIAFF